METLVSAYGKPATLENFRIIHPAGLSDPPACPLVVLRSRKRLSDSSLVRESYEARSRQDDVILRQEGRVRDGP